jgi:hypothetical protein
MKEAFFMNIYIPIQHTVFRDLIIIPVFFHSENCNSFLIYVAERATYRIQPQNLHLIEPAGI